MAVLCVVNCHWRLADWSIVSSAIASLVHGPARLTRSSPPTAHWPLPTAHASTACSLPYIIILLSIRALLGPVSYERTTHIHFTFHLLPLALPRMSSAAPPPPSLLRPCAWPARRHECAVLRSVLHPRCATARSVHVFGPPNAGKTAVVLDTLRLAHCTFVFVDCFTVASERAALASILNQLSSRASKLDEDDDDDDSESDGVGGGQYSTLHGNNGMGVDVNQQSASTSSQSLSFPHYHTAASVPLPSLRDGLLGVAIRLRSLPHLLGRTAFIVLKEPSALSSPPGSGSGSGSGGGGISAGSPHSHSNSHSPSSDLLAGLLSLTDVCQRHVTVVLIDRGGPLVAAVDGADGCLPVHFPPYSAEQLAAIIAHSLAQDDAHTATATATSTAVPSGDALLRFVSDAVQSFVSATRDLRELHRLVAVLMRAVRNSASSRGDGHADGSSGYLLHAMRAEVAELASSAVYRLDYTDTAVAAASSAERESPAAGGLASWAALLSRHLSVAQFHLLFAAYIASHNSTHDDTSIFASERTKVSQHAKPFIPSLSTHAIHSIHPVIGSAECGSPSPVHLLFAGLC